MADPYVIDIKHISKTYQKGVKALDGLSLQVAPGEIFGLLGPNGAGKSTLVKALLTIIRPSECEGTMLGAKIGSRDRLQRVGYLPEHVRFPDYLTGAQVLDYCGGLADVRQPERKRRAAELLELVSMGEWRDKRIGTYSKGMKQRIGIAQALINDPEIVFLDEPTDGVDPQGRIEIREVMKRIRSEGKTVFVNSHLLNELERVGDRVAILNKGVVQREGKLADLVGNDKHFEIGVVGRVPAGSAAAGLVAGLAGQVVDEGIGTRIHLPGAELNAVQPIIDALRKDGIAIAMVQQVTKSLEELFLDTIDASRMPPGTPPPPPPPPPAN